MSHVLVPGVRLLGHRAERGRLEPEGTVATGARPDQRLVHVLVGHGDRVVGDERRAARQHLVEDAAERVDVGAMVHGLAASLFGRDVRGGSEDGGATGDARPGDPCAIPRSISFVRPSGWIITLAGFTS